MLGHNPDTYQQIFAALSRAFKPRLGEKENGYIPVMRALKSELEISTNNCPSCPAEGRTLFGPAGFFDRLRSVHHLADNQFSGALKKIPNTPESQPAINALQLGLEIARREIQADLDAREKASYFTP